MSLLRICRKDFSTEVFELGPSMRPRGNVLIERHVLQEELAELRAHEDGRQLQGSGMCKGQGGSMCKVQGGGMGQGTDFL